jgi:hypothetical protein
MAGRIAGADGQALRPCVGQNPWAVAAVPRRLARTVVARLHKSDVWTLDETAFPTAGAHSVGVARQSCGTRGARWRTARSPCAGMGVVLRPVVRSTGGRICPKHGSKTGNGRPTSECHRTRPLSGRPRSRWRGLPTCWPGRCPPCRSWRIPCTATISGVDHTCGGGRCHLSSRSKAVRACGPRIQTGRCHPPRRLAGHDDIPHGRRGRDRGG